MEMETVTLKNGAVEARALVQVTMLSLKTLAETEPIAFYELAQKARNNSHKPFGNTGEKLTALSLLAGNNTAGYSMHDSIRNIVLSAVEGEGLDMTLGPPIAAMQPVEAL